MQHGKPRTHSPTSFEANQALLEQSMALEARFGDRTQVLNLQTPEEKVENLKREAMEPFDPESLPPTLMYVSISGIIQSAQMKDCTYAKLKYYLTVGSDWDLIDGTVEDESQFGTINHNRDDQKTVFNVPFNAMYRTLDIMGWPKLVIKFEGPDDFGKNIVKGYATCSVPVCPGNHNIECYIFRPIQPKYIGTIFGSQPKVHNQEADETSIVKGVGREVSSVEHMGSIKVTINVSHKNFQKFGFLV